MEDEQLSAACHLGILLVFSKGDRKPIRCNADIPKRWRSRPSWTARVEQRSPLLTSEQAIHRCDERGIMPNRPRLIGIERGGCVDRQLPFIYS